MTIRRFDLHQSVLDLHDRQYDRPTDDRRLGSALTDWFSIGDSVSTIRICLADPYQQALAAALIALDASVALVDGGSARLDQRLLADGGIDLDGRDGAAAARELLIPRLPRGAQSALASAKTDTEISAAARLSLNGDAAVMLVGVAPHPVRARQIESVVRGRPLSDRIIDVAAQTARSEAQPYGIGELTDGVAVDLVEDAVRRLCRRLRERMDSDELQRQRHGQSPHRRDPARRW